MTRICGRDKGDHKTGDFGHTKETQLIFDPDDPKPLTYREFDKRYSSGKENKFSKGTSGSAEYCVPNFKKGSLIVHVKKDGLKPKYVGTNFEDICSKMWEDLGNSGNPTGLGAGNQRDAGLFIKIIENEVKNSNSEYKFTQEEKDSVRIEARVSSEFLGESTPAEDSDVADKKIEGEDVNSEDLIDGLQANKNLIVEGVAGSGKSHMLQELRESGVYGENGSQIEVVVFHPSTSYEEFVSGIRPNFMNKEGEGGFVSQEGVFVEMCNRAAANPDKNFLLFIDEINRANTARVFGDLMLVIEDSKRVDFSKIDGDTQGESSENSAERGESDVKPQIIDLSTGEPLKVQGEEKREEIKKGCRYGALFSAQATVPSDEDNKPTEYVRLQTSIYKTAEREDEPIEFNKLVVPVNLHVLGTMNTTDRSVGTIDLALRRRFHWITQDPMSNKDKLLTALKLSGDKDKSVGLVADWFMDANTVLKTEVGPDARLGHAYFFGKDGDEKTIAEALVTQLLEIIYTFNIKEDVLEKIGLPPIGDYVGSKLDYEGKGLGRRPVVKKPDDKGKSPTADGGNSSENKSPESALPDDGQGEPQP